ncbi:hypothetical protein IZ6_24850 [Terrihabitans soli]|uniref:Glutaredoxin domain-containing protein n=1 Tax=Terrihabitans soli TaxID=708113 RepID=A0A6S6QXJ0_9HYPH|nr:glutaredoxin domain-containing protein [Terrihabitans soli]BCJ91750.1 hypothetical protein IZ6_24850 [Terrihabitans soli]
MTFEIITKPGCIYCDMAKALLAPYGYKETVCSTPEQIAAFKAEGWRSFPQIFENGLPIGGYTELEAYLEFVF